MNEPVVPFWFRLRQGKAEPVGESTVRLTAPNLAEAFIHVERDASGRFLASVRGTADGPPLASSDVVYDNEEDAWGAAFELYRTQIVT